MGRRSNDEHKICNHSRIVFGNSDRSCKRLHCICIYISNAEYRYTKREYSCSSIFDLHHNYDHADGFIDYTGSNL